MPEAMKSLLPVSFVFLCLPFFSDTQIWRKLFSHVKREEVHQPQPQGTVVFVSILFYHGAPTLPDGEQDLMENYMKSFDAEGKWLHERYKNLIPPFYSKNDSYFRSVDEDLAITSILSVMAGVYQPPNSSSKWNSIIKWQPIPVHAVPILQDDLLMLKKCSKHTQLQKKLLQSQNFTNFYENHKHVYNAVAENSGLNLSTDLIVELPNVHNVLHSSQLMNRTLPSWASPIWSELTYLSVFGSKIPTYTPHLSRLKAGPLLKEMVSHMQNKINGTLEPDRKLLYYSANEDTLISFLNSLNMFNNLKIHQTAFILVELQVVKEEYFVAVQFRNSTRTEPYLLTIPGCSSLCAFDKFVKIVQPIIPENWEEECQT